MVFKSYLLILPGILAFTCWRILNPVHTQLEKDQLPPFLEGHWTAPLIIHNKLFTPLNPVSSFHFSIQCRHKLLKFPKTKVPAHVLLLTTLLAGDIESNPGPGRRPKFPCQICHKAAKWGQKAIECDKCQGWFHVTCLNMNEMIYNVLSEHPSYSWSCCNCGLPNFSSTFMESLLDLELSNSFSLLSHDSVEHSIHVMSQNPGVPLSASSPKIDRRNVRPKLNPSSNLRTLSAELSRRRLPTNLKKLKIINVNCQSIRAKLPSFEVMLATEDPDIVIGTESWLNDSIATGEVFPKLV
ncbi:Pygopus-like 1 [Holothuria leucospilota]|uniref:Pygopus-like 1 n=1 Tax=Holothuria leucospilota TaxID=206669 RepID=A0A9Q0YAI3_HOLLE|nr:Pygopus-like 1 [Holothuria leucospilota]